MQEKYGRSKSNYADQSSSSSSSPSLNGSVPSLLDLYFASHRNHAIQPQAALNIASLKQSEGVSNLDFDSYQNVKSTSHSIVDDNNDEMNLNKSLKGVTHNGNYPQQAPRLDLQWHRLDHSNAQSNSSSEASKAASSVLNRYQGQSPDVSLNDTWGNPLGHFISSSSSLTTPHTNSSSNSGTNSTSNELTEEQFTQLMNHFDHQAALETSSSMPSTSYSSNGASESSTSEPINVYAWLAGHVQRQSLSPSKPIWHDERVTMKGRESSTDKGTVLQVPEVNMLPNLQEAKSQGKNNLITTWQSHHPSSSSKSRKLLPALTKSKGKDRSKSSDDTESLMEQNGDSIEEIEDEEEFSPKVRKILIPIESSTSDNEVRSKFIVRHVCPYRDCNRDFSTSGHARRHSRVHDTFRQYGCPHEGCPASFTRRDNCKQHQKNSHDKVLDAIKFKREREGKVKVE